jgi:hypothetical protein
MQVKAGQEPVEEHGEEADQKRVLCVFIVGYDFRSSRSCKLFSMTTALNIIENVLQSNEKRYAEKREQRGGHWSLRERAGRSCHRRRKR